MISNDYHNIRLLLLLTIIASSKNCTILVIVKENIFLNVCVHVNAQVCVQCTWIDVCICVIFNVSL